ncbi:hypothetical protein CIC12_18770 [Burkholderia sp. SG-MS1]|nr:hypothetical protein [Paraburkholderia sp. SG-MS1]
MATLSSTGAWASDIQCATTRQPAERVICDHAILNNEYDDIAAAQQALLNSGKLSPDQLTRWRQSRNACSDVHCIDTVFAQWKTMARAVEANAAVVPAPAIASATEVAPVGPASDADTLSASQGLPASAAALPTSEASLVRQGSAAGIALPQPVASQVSSPVTPSSASGVGESRSNAGLSAGLLLVFLIAIAAGAFFIRRSIGLRRSEKTRERSR